MNKYLLLFIINLIIWISIIFFLVLFKKKITKDNKKDLVFIIVSILTVLIHYSSFFYSKIDNGSWGLEDNMVLPVYPCNVIMWLCTTLSFLMIIGKKESKAFIHLAEFTFLGGSICGFVGMAFNISFLNVPNIKDFYVMKGLISHVTMEFCCVYLYVMGYVRINTLRNMVSCVMGLLLFIFCAVYCKIVYKFTSFEDVNPMFLSAPYDNIPFLNFFTAMPIILILVFGLLTLYEIFIYPKEDRWYVKIKNKKDNVESEA